MRIRNLAGWSLGALALLCGCASSITDNALTALRAPTMPIPIVFVHGNGETAALWYTTIWRFESNGYPRERLFAIDFTNPQARADDAVVEEGRSGSS